MIGIIGRSKIWISSLIYIYAILLMLDIQIDYLFIALSELANNLCF